MATAFSIGDIVIPNVPYVEETLSLETSPQIRQAVATLGVLRCEPCEILDCGTIAFPSLSFVQLRPTDTTHHLYKRGNGVLIYVDNDTQLNNSLEFSTAFIKDKCFIKVLNNSGSLISKNLIVRQTGYNDAMQLPEIDLADATTETNAVVFGVTVEDIPDGEMGTILTSGSFVINTTGYTIGGPVYLSDTPGAISVTEGTESITVGRVMVVGADGVISITSTLSGAGGGGGGGGFFTEGIGAYSAIGQGTIAPLAYGANSLVHGNGCVDKQINYYGGYNDNNFVQGDRCVMADSTQANTIHYGTDWAAHFPVVAGYPAYLDTQGSLVQGKLCQVYGGGYGVFAQGFKQYALYACGLFMQGYQNYSYGGCYTFMQGGSNTTNGFAGNSFIQGADNNLEFFNNSVLAQGLRNEVYSYNGPSLVQGINNILYASSSDSLVQGSLNDVGVRTMNAYYDHSGNAGHCLVQGRRNYVDARCLDNLVQGSNNDLRVYENTSAPYDFIASQQTMIQGNQNKNYGASRAFIQGILNRNYGSNSIVQGTSCHNKQKNYYGGHIANAFVQGYKCVAADSTQANTIHYGSDWATFFGSYAGYPFYDPDIHGTFVQGNNCKSYAGYGVFVQGYKQYNLYGFGSLIQGYRNFNYGGDNFLQGDDIRNWGRNHLVQGRNNRVYGAGGCFAQGQNHQIGLAGAPWNTYTLVQGNNIYVSDNQEIVFAQGDTIDISGSRAFAQGEHVAVPRDDQKTWGSNRASFPLGLAQSSKIIKYVETTDATTTTLLTVDLEDLKAYSIKCNVAARNETTGTQNASFLLDQAIAYRNGGFAVLTGSPIAFTKAESTAVTWTVTLEAQASTNNLRVRVTGAGGQTINWCCDLEFVEVAN